MEVKDQETCSGIKGGVDSVRLKRVSSILKSSGKFNIRNFFFVLLCFELNFFSFLPFFIQKFIHSFIHSSISSLFPSSPPPVLLPISFIHLFIPPLFSFPPSSLPPFLFPPFLLSFNLFLPRFLSSFLLSLLVVFFYQDGHAFVYSLASSCITSFCIDFFFFYIFCGSSVFSFARFVFIIFFVVTPKYFFFFLSCSSYLLSVYIFVRYLYLNLAIVILFFLAF